MDAVWQVAAIVAMARRTHFVVLLGFILGLPALAGEIGWWDPAWKCRREVAALAGTSGSEVATVAFATGGYLKSDGSDVRVVTGGRLTPHQVVVVGPGDFCRIAFQMVRGVTRYQVYYGNPQARALEERWEPRAGLILKTSRYNDAPCETLEGIRKVAEESRPIYGADFVDQVFHGFNPFGPSFNYVSAYRGWLQCGKAGRYVFATTSGGPSFLAIDGRLVVGRSGWHGPADRAYHRGEVTLSEGLHRFEYYTVQRWGRQAAVAAWQPPDAPANKFEVIPAQAFPPVVRATLMDYRVQGESIAADFVWENVGETEVGGHFMVRLRFTDRSQPSPGVGATREWSFGDGLKSAETIPQHIYLAEGIYPVTLTIRRGEERYSVTHRVSVSRAWEEQLKREPEPLSRYIQEVAKYPLEQVLAPALAGAVRLFHAGEKWDLVAAAGRVLLQRQEFAGTSSSELFEAFRTVAVDTRAKDGDPQFALRILARGEEVVTERAHKAKLALELGDTHFYYGRDVIKARAEYQRLLRRYEDVDPTTVRLAHIRLGDTFVVTGGYDDALRHYRRAEAMPAGTTGPRREVAIGSRALETEDYLRRNELDAAQETLNAWQWDHPTEKLRGHWSVLMARWCIASGKIGDAIRQLQYLVSVNPQSEFAPQALWLLAECHEREGRIAQAIQALETLKEQYRESPESQKVDKRLGELAKKKR